MKKIMNITTNSDDILRFADNEDLKAFYQAFGFDGVEVLQAGEDEKAVILPNDTMGIHLNFFSSWMDLWTNRQEKVLQEFDDWETVKRIYGGTTKSAIVDMFRKNLTFAASLSPEYMVLHVADCTMAESMRRRFSYTDEEVIDAAADLVNQITSFIQGTPLLLFENLWYPGLTMLRPEMTYRLLEKVKYAHKGIMLDIGHLLHTNTALRSLDDAIAYIKDVLSRYDDLSCIKGIHLHQTLSGAYSEMLASEWMPKQGNYRERYWDVMSHIYRIDSHKPFTHEKINEVIAMIAPEYLVCEQMSGSREEHYKMLEEQMQFLTV